MREGARQPVERHAAGQGAGLLLHPIAFQQDDPAGGPSPPREAPVAGQQQAVLRLGAAEQLGIARPAAGDGRVVTGAAQPVPEPMQHLVAKEAQGSHMGLSMLALGGMLG